LSLYIYLKKYFIKETIVYFINHLKKNIFLFCQENRFVDAQENEINEIINQFLPAENFSGTFFYVKKEPEICPHFFY
jgi:hypothetical protein